MNEENEPEPVVKVVVEGHMDGCSYPDTRQWCDDHIKEAWQGVM